ncbi:MAG: RNA methyltransferase [Candidatus Hinthialibacter antarcticus]|nr:RNA methyltransferase [Candidatus Hinthialibacter antarcticus]
MKTTDIAVILVRPQIPENVGFVARSMKAFGFDDLRLVSDPARWSLNSPAYRTASGAEDRLLNMALFESLDDAVADCHRVYAFSRREHGFHRPGLELVEWSQGDWRAQSGTRVGLLFGPEDAGLTNEDKHVCDAVVEIPLQAETLSLNLAHAVAIALYELTRNPAPAPVERPAPASRENLARIGDELLAVLDHGGFFKAGRREQQFEVVRDLLYRLQLTQDEYPVLMGALKSIQKK